MKPVTILRTAATTLALAALAAGSGVWAEQGPPAAQPPGGQPPTSVGMVKKGKAPVSNEVLKVKLPKPQEADLPNGLHLMVLEDHRLPRISAQLMIPGAGGYYDPADKIGLATYAAQMMREGTKSFDSQRMAQELETMAASVGVGAGLSSPTASLSASALTEHFPRVFDIAAEVLLAPTFPAVEWDRLKTRTKAQLTQNRTQPGFLAGEMMNKVLYGTHPAGRIAPTPANLDAITREAMIEFHRSRYVPDHAVIAFAGDITLAEARKLVETRLGEWKKSGAVKPTVEDPPAVGPAKVYLVNRPGSVQTTLLVAAQSMNRLDPDFEELTVANRVLGGTMGRLFRHLREEKGYTYGVGSGFSASNHRGDWTASTSVRTEVTDAALTDLLKDIAEMRDAPVPADELADHQRATAAGFARSLESPQQVLGYYTQSWLYGLPADYWDTYPAKIAGVTAAQAQAVAKKYWDAPRLQIVAVGDASKITDALKKHGTLEVYDAEGKRIQ
jgi:zinc protease